MVTKRQKSQSTKVPKRSLVKELKQSIKEIKAHNKGKITLRTHVFEPMPQPKINAAIIRDTRERLHLSRAVFAMRLRVRLRTLEKWEQGATVPNDQAAVLILLARKFPDTLSRLAEI